MVPEYNLKMHMDLGPNSDMFKLYVGKMDFYSLPYLYDNEEKDDEKRSLDCVVDLNRGRIRFSATNPWNNNEFVKSLQEKFDGEQI